MKEKKPGWKGRDKTVFICRWHDPIYRKYEGIHEVLELKKSLGRVQNIRSIRKKNRCIFIF